MKRAKKGPVDQRLARLLEVLSPWTGTSLTYRQLAAEIGPPATESAIKKWPQRKKFPADVARLIVDKARRRGVEGVTLEWLLWGDGPGPRTGPDKARVVSADDGTPFEQESGPDLPHGQFAARIAAALQKDLSHNEFGQWSSAEVQRTVLWALKDLARRLRVLRFDMGETFELTDGWAGEIGLPVRSNTDADAPTDRAL